MTFAMGARAAELRPTLTRANEKEKSLITRSPPGPVTTYGYWLTGLRRSSMAGLAWSSAKLSSR